MSTVIDRALVEYSRRVITSLQTPEGAYPASPTFSAYRGYCWFRDGSFIADGASAAGEIESATRFFEWCAAVLDRHATTIDEVVAAAERGEQTPGERMLPARFTFAMDLGDDPWWDFQLDGYGTWLWALKEHVTRHHIDPSRWAGPVGLTVEYLLASWRRPCYDWWEEHAEQVHVSTLGCISAGLDAAVELGVLEPDLAQRARAEAIQVRTLIVEEGVHDGHLSKWLGSPEVDASVLSLIAPLRVIDAADPLARATVDAITEALDVDGGVHRFLADTFYGGGQWPLLSCFAGLSRHALGDADQAVTYLEWAASTATDSLDLPEQVESHLLDSTFRDQWIERWGTVATPLLWSHAMFLRLDAEVNP